jgi:hypothetical protein
MEPEKRMTPFGASLFPLKRWIVVGFESYTIYIFAKYQTPLKKGVPPVESSIGNLGGSALRASSLGESSIGNLGWGCPSPVRGSISNLFR